MSIRNRALVTPGLLTWSRVTAGYTVAEAAKKLGQSEERIAGWEAGTEEISISQLRDLSAAYGRSLAVFFLPEAPKEDDAMRDFRRLPDVVPGRESPEMRREFRRARARRFVALDLYEELGEEPPKFALAANMTEAADDVATRIRSVLGVDWLEQINWPSPDAAYSRWSAKLEAAGVLVFQASGVPLTEFRGVALYEFPLPAILVNNRDAPNGRLFTLLHELAHLALFAGSPNNPPVDAPRVETFVNAIAAATLLPTQQLRADPLLAANRTEEAWTDATIAKAARRFNVSRDAFVRRLSDLDVVSPRFYQEKHALYRFDVRKPQADGSGPPPHMKSLSAAGRSFVRLVLENYRQERITGSDVSNFLHLKLKHLSRLEDALSLGPGRAA
jgi:Zn-dependent peptidase ImmA (M78 family)/transcriptional regulator with XRE-family HTH domain